MPLCAVFEIFFKNACFFALKYVRMNRYVVRATQAQREASFMDYYIEYMVRKKTTIKERLIIAGSVVPAAIVSLLLFLILIPLNQGMFAMLGIAAAWYGFYRIAGISHVEFEYMMTNGDLDVDRITARRNRKRLLSISAHTIEVLAPVFRLGEYAVTEAKVVDASIDSKGADTYFLIAYQNSQRILLFFNPSERILEMFQKHNPRKVFIEKY